MAEYVSHPRRRFARGCTIRFGGDDAGAAQGMGPVFSSREDGLERQACGEAQPEPVELVIQALRHAGRFDPEQARQRLERWVPALAKALQAGVPRPLAGIAG